MKERFPPIFSCTAEHDRCQETIYHGRQGIPTSFGQFISLILKELRGRYKKNFRKKFLSGDKSFGFFSFPIERDKPRGTTYRGPKGMRTIILEIKDHFFRT